MTDKSHRKPGVAIAALASQQHGVVSRDQLRAIGLSDQMIDDRMASGTLLPVFRGVFSVGHRAFGRHGLMLAATLACGEAAVVSHSSAAELHGLWDRQPVVIDVISGSGCGRGLPGIRWHRGQALWSDEATRHEGVPCTTVARTLVDMAGTLGDRSLRRMVEQAAVSRALDVAAMERSLARGRRRGAPRLRLLLEPWRHMGDELPRLRSRTEARLLAAVVEHGLPLPRCNALLRLEGRTLEVDLLWEEQRLVIETDGEATHGTRAAFQRDRWRDQVLSAAGYRTARVTWRQLDREQGAVLARIRKMLMAAQP